MPHTTDNQKKKEQKTLRPYQTPQLLVYGAVKDLTAGGTGSVVETGNSASNKRP